MRGAISESTPPPQAAESFFQFKLQSQPIFHVNTRDLGKITAVPRQQRSSTRHDNRGDLEVHRADTNSLPPESGKLVGRGLVEWKNLPLGEKITKSKEAFVCRDLQMNVRVPTN